MAERYIYDKRIQNAAIRRRLDRRFASWVLVSALAGTFIAFGFVYSARCHFEAVNLGYEIEQQRTEIERKAELQRQLELERARALAPEVLEQRARKLGLDHPEPLAQRQTRPADRRGRQVSP